MNMINEIRQSIHAVIDAAMDVTQEGVAHVHAEYAGNVDSIAVYANPAGDYQNRLLKDGSVGEMRVYLDGNRNQVIEKLRDMRDRIYDLRETAPTARDALLERKRNLLQELADIERQFDVA